MSDITFIDVTAPSWFKHKGEWIHVVFSIENDRVNCYVNGKLNTSYTLTIFQNAQKSTPKDAYNKGERGKDFVDLNEPIILKEWAEQNNPSVWLKVNEPIEMKDTPPGALTEKKIIQITHPPKTVLNCSKCGSYAVTMDGKYCSSIKSGKRCNGKIGRIPNPIIPKFAVPIEEVENLLLGKEEYKKKLIEHGILLVKKKNTKKK